MAPNVLFITVDQWRGDCLSSAGHPVVQTPHLDALAASGARFARHYAQAAPCGPSRASLLTGTYLHTHRSTFNGTPLDARFTNVALEARAAGYRPLLYGYTDTTVDPRTVAPDDPRLSTYESVLPGFEHAQPLDEEYAPWFAWLAERGYDLSDPQRYLRPDPDHPGAGSHGRTWAPTPYSAEHTETAFITGRVIEDIDAALAAGEGAFFVHASYVRPHPPFTVPAPYHDLYDPADVPAPVLAPTADDEAALHPFVAAAMGWEWSRADPDPAEVRQLRATYYGMMTEVDAQLGRLLAALEERGLADDTIVIVTSDHGEMLGDHRLMSKLGFWDEAFHIPLIVRAPGCPPGQVIDEFTENVDIMATILELIDVEVPAQCQGRSLVPFLRGSPPEDWRTAVHWEFDFRVFRPIVPRPARARHPARAPHAAREVRALLGPALALVRPRRGPGAAGRPPRRSRVLDTRPGRGRGRARVAPGKRRATPHQPHRHTVGDAHPAPTARSGDRLARPGLSGMLRRPPARPATQAGRFSGVRLRSGRPPAGTPRGSPWPRQGWSWGVRGRRGRCPAR